MEEKTNKSIKNWAQDDRPREKLEFKGKETLSNSELLAIILGSGSRNKSAIDLAKEILEHCKNNLADLNRLSLQQLKKFKGVGTAKAINILAALELGNRKQNSDAKSIESIHSSKDSYEHFKYHLQDLTIEETWVMYLTRSNSVIEIVKMSSGGITNTIMDQRLIFSKALELKAICIILAHNHPSGNLKPSQADIEITNKIKQAGTTLDICLLDHLIIAGNSYFSFADNALL